MKLLTVERFNTNQIVKGKKAGTFVILGFRIIDAIPSAQLKLVNPQDHTQTGEGEMALPLSLLLPLHPIHSREK